MYYFGYVLLRVVVAMQGSETCRLVYAWKQRPNRVVVLILSLDVDEMCVMRLPLNNLPCNRVA